MKKIMFALCCLMMVGCGTSTSDRLNADGKATLKVLYVGGASDFESHGSKATPEETKASVQARTAAWEAMLKERFDSVAVVQGSDYKMELSQGYDVTIIDGSIPTMRPREMVRDANGRVTKVIPALRLTEEYDAATITIGQQSEHTGRGIGTKHDWYCLCLDAEAHSLVEDHPIFKGPFKTELTFEKKPIPEDALHYQYFFDEKLPDSVMMWRVQTKGYKTDEGFPIGMVSRPWGYADSPDVEYISSGVCAKTIDAVAIGRHANFLHWGFAASPTYMTEEAKAVFANAVCYIAKFKGQKPLARKYSDRVATREYLKELKYLATLPPYEERVGWTVEANERGFKQQAEAKAKRARGEKLTSEEEYYLNFQPSEPMTREAYTQRYHKNAYTILGTNYDAYIPYYDENLPYFYGGKGSYVMTVDEDCKAWGIDNHDLALLEKAISSWEKGEEVERAQRVLNRYTLCPFDKVEEWRAWFNKYRKKLFFTESGGWVFMIDGPATLPGNDYKARERKEAAKAQPAETSEMEPVTVAATATKVGEQPAIEVRMNIHMGYHVYRTVSAQDAYIPVKITPALPEGAKAAPMIAPQARPFGSTGTTVYEGEVSFVVPIEGAVKGEVKCEVEWQACDAHVCTPPTTKELVVKF